MHKANFLCPDVSTLLEYLDGNSSPTVIEHVRHCSTCRVHAAQLEATMQAFTHKLTADTCPDDMLLTDYYFSTIASEPIVLLTHERCNELSQHLFTCTRCRQMVQEMLSADTLSEFGPPPTLILPFFPFQETIGMNTAQVRGEQQLAIYHITDAAHGAIELSIQALPIQDCVQRLSGLLLSSDVADEISVTLVQRNASADWTHTELCEFGMFQFDHVPVGRYDLLVHGLSVPLCLRDVLCPEC